MNDDQLTADLHAAFHDVTSDLVYTRTAPQLRRSPLQAAPAAALVAGVATVALVPVLAGQTASGPTGVTDRDGATSAVAAPDVSRGLVADSLVFAGATYSYVRDAGQGELVFREVGDLPGGVEQVETSVDAQAWFGDDPVTGDPALFVRAATRFEGQVFSMGGAGWTSDELVDVLEGRRPVE